MKKATSEESEYMINSRLFCRVPTNHCIVDRRSVRSIQCPTLLWFIALLAIGNFSQTFALISTTHSIQHQRLKSSTLCMASKSPCFAAAAVAIFLGTSLAPHVKIAFAEEESVNVISELAQYEEETESFNRLEKRKDPKRFIADLKRDLGAPMKPSKLGTLTTAQKDKELKDAREVVLTLKAYLDEAERDLFLRNWANLQVYVFTFADQEQAFVTLTEGLFPSDDKLDKSARDAMSFEAKQIFLALDDLQEAAKDGRFKPAQRAYSRLLLSYDRFLKAGDLYPTYDAITSTEIFFTNTPKNTLRFDTAEKVQVLDSVVLTAGPDMGKIATVVFIDGTNAVIKLDKDGKSYQEVKYVKLDILARNPDVESNAMFKRSSPSKLKVSKRSIAGTSTEGTDLAGKDVANDGEDKSGRATNKASK